MNPENVVANSELIQELYEKYLRDPQSVHPSWQRYFLNLEAPISAKPVGEKPGEDLRVAHLINAWRTWGHLMADINPIATKELVLPEELQLTRFGLSEDDLNTPFPTFGLLDKEKATLSEIVAALKEIYAGSVGVEYRNIKNMELKDWIQEQIEPSRFQSNLTIDQKKLILHYLNKSELFEIFLHTKYTGQKRFSIEGGEVLIPMLAMLVEKGSMLGIQEFVLGMAHRGRLNVLCNILDKSYAQIFSEFQEGYIPDSFEGSGDVKYHKGFTSNVKTAGGKNVVIDLAPNPSHLEAVDPVVEGETFAKQIRHQDIQKAKIIPVLIHGDAALSGQGVVYETMQLSKLEGYDTGGTIHLVINNQIGFTTLPKDSRSTPYCTDIAKAFDVPVFHVNAENPEKCVMAVLMALDIRQKFKIDVMIDINCWRKFGHNESDEPAYTQPLEYRLIRNKKSIREQYRDELISQGVLERQMAEALEKEFKENLQNSLNELQFPKGKKTVEKKVPDELFAPVKTAVSEEVLDAVAKKALFIPADFVIHPKLKKVLEEREEMSLGKRGIDWGMAEMLAFGTLLWQEHPIRLAGQDCQRGTFSHRHAAWMDQEKQQVYIPLQHLKKEQGRFDVINSPLSENACLAFEYGYSIELLESLVIWEAQFGDFANGAQVVIDQFISTSEQKWNQKSGLTLLLPHGYEGQGPEHSSGRMERFLTLSGDNNLFICNPSTPAQLFHLLRRQVLSSLKKPLIVFTPKGLLRHPACVSVKKDLSEGKFEEIIDDPSSSKKLEKLILCSGHVYYDLLEWRKESSAAIIRIEQLCPLHEKRLIEIVSGYNGLKEIVFVQEEPENMGPWRYLRPLLEAALPLKPRFVGREKSASPAVGSHAIHLQQLLKIKKEVFG